MKIKEKEYNLLNEIYKYKYYIPESDNDIKELLKMIKGMDEIVNKSVTNDNVSTKKWSERKVSLWGMVKSIFDYWKWDKETIEKYFSVTSATEFRPLAIYDYGLKY